MIQLFKDQDDWWINLLYGLFDKKTEPLSFLTGNLMENTTNFNDAVSLLSKTDLIAPAYFIVGGVEPEQGVVITRNQSQVVNLWKLDSKSIGIGSWYLLKTNCDHWLPPPPNDDRRDPGMSAMNAIGQNNMQFARLNKFNKIR